MLQNYSILIVILCMTLKKIYPQNCGTLEEAGKCPRLNVSYRPTIKDPLVLLLKVSSWWLSAAASNAADAPPPSSPCVRISVTKTGREVDCMYNMYDHRPHKAAVVRVIGLDKDNKTEILSEGPIHKYPQQPIYPRNYSNFMFENSMVKSTICWDPVSYKFTNYRFIVRNPYEFKNTTMEKKGQQTRFRHLAQYLLLIGINARMPTSEIHLALLGKEIKERLDINDVIYYQRERKHRNRIFVGGTGYYPELEVKCSEDIVKKNNKKPNKKG